MQKNRPKWFQENIVLAPAQEKIIKSSDLKIPLKIFPNNEKSSINKQDDLKTILLNELVEFKRQHLYEEALSCIQTIFELNLADNNTFYELADIYFLTKDYSRCYNWLNKFMSNEIDNYRGYLLKIKLQLELNQKDDALITFNHLIENNLGAFTDEDFLVLDSIIERLKKIFRLNKLLRRCPKLDDYQKERRKKLKQTKIINNMTITNDKEITSSMSNENIILQNTINHIWDMQTASNEDINNLLHAPIEQISICIFNQVLSYKKKIWLFNYLADIFRQHDNINSALYLLRQALILDDENDFILKNLGYLLYKKGEFNSALVILEDIAVKDFSTIDIIEKCQNYHS